LALATELPIDNTSIWMTDISPDALAVARANLAGIGRPARNVTIIESRWFDALPANLQADVIVSNPPYIALDSPDVDGSVSDYEPEVALYSGPDGLDAIREIIQTAGDFLTANGALVLEIGADQRLATEFLFEEHGYVDCEVRRDAFGHDRIAIGYWPDSAR
jgi:release factor glutamine methyltransferase